MSRPDSPDVAAERRQRGTPEELDTLGVHAALTLGALVLRGRKADDATAGSLAMARIFRMSAAERDGLALVDDLTVDALEKDADAGSLMGLPWALSAVRAGAGELAVEQWRDVGELVARTGETVQAFLEAKGLADGWVGSLLDENARPLQTEELDADMRAMLAIDGGVHGLLVFDALLAGLLDKLGQPTWATKVRATTTEERGERWRLGAVRGAGETVFRAVWAGILEGRARAAKETEALEERRRKVPVASMHALPAAVAMAGARATETPGSLALRGPAAGIVVFENPERWREVGDAAATLASWLAEVAHRQWLAGVATWQLVAVPANARTLARLGVLSDAKRPEAELAELLEALTTVRIGLSSDNEQRANTGRFVLDYLPSETRWTTEKGGRTWVEYVVTVGWPLAPLQLEGAMAERGLDIPRELSFYGPLFNPQWVPVTGYRKTHRVQRLAGAVGLGQWLVSRREEYAALGGVRLDTARPYFQRMGLYHRSHASLVEDVLGLWTKPLEVSQRHLALEGEPAAPSGAMLVPTKVDGVYRLGPDYKAQEALILDGAKLTADAKRGVGPWLKGKGKGKGKPKG